MVRFRGSMSQAKVAAEMKRLGHAWAQATVWSIEQGTRPLRLAEAADLATVLGVFSPLEFVEGAGRARLRVAVQELGRRTRQLEDDRELLLGFAEHLDGVMHAERADAEGEAEAEVVDAAFELVYEHLARLKGDLWRQQLREAGFEHLAVPHGQ